MAESVSSLLRRSVELLAAEVPASHQRTLESLGGLVVALDVDGEVFSLTGGRRFVIADGEPGAAGVRITTSRAAILDVLDARIGLTDAVEAGSLAVRGSLDDVLRAHDTLHAYVHAAVRGPAHLGLMDELRAGLP